MSLIERTSNPYPRLSGRKLLIRGAILVTGLTVAAAFHDGDSVPSQPANPPATSPDCSYLVQPGDRLDTIAKGRQSLVLDLKEANGGTSYIEPGNVISGIGGAACAQLEEIGVIVTRNTFSGDN